MIYSHYLTKNLKFPGLVLFIALTTFACKNEPVVDYVVLSGQIENKATDKVIIVADDAEHALTLNEDGTFRDTLNLEAGYYRLAHGEVTNLYLAPGYDLKVYLNTEAFDESIRYQGIGAEVNNYLVQKLLIQEELIPDGVELYKSDEGVFIQEIEKLKKARMDRLDSTKAVDPTFYELEKKNLKYDYLLALNNYETYHAYYAGKPDFKASDSLKAPLDDINLDNEEDYKNFASYKSLVDGKLLSYSMVQENPDELGVYFDRIKKLESQVIKNGVMSTLRYSLSPAHPEMETMYKGIMEISTDSAFRASMTEKYEKNKNLVKGQPAPRFNYENFAGGQTSMEDLKGKYVYFDIWATWCGPCIREIPFLKQIEKKYEGHNVQFVSVSIDPKRDYEKWRTFVEEKELGGMQLYADGDWKSSIIRDYAIEGIPRFILVNPDGNIYSADAPRPSNPKLQEMFDELLTAES